MRHNRDIFPANTMAYDNAPDRPLGRIYVSSFGFSCANNISVFALMRVL